METILYNISQVLGITVIHSIWQGLLVYFGLRIIFSAVLGLSPAKKYNLSAAAMLSLMLWFIYTLVIEVQSYTWITANPSNLSPLLPYVTAPHGQTFTVNPSLFYRTLTAYLPYVSLLYVIGLLANITRLGWEWNKVRQLKQALVPALQMQQIVKEFSKKLNITKYIQINFSEKVDVPCMIGYFKPLILLPVSLATYLSADEVEAILLHELSHIKRNDYLVNLLQQVIAVILFFNPFAQLINRIINQERENSCDDLVVEKTGKPLIYAQALLKLEESKAPRLQLALAATGKKFHLLNRIERIMKTKKQFGNTRHLIIALFLLAGSLSSIAWFNPKIAGESTKAKAVKTVKAKNTAAIISPSFFAPQTVVKRTVKDTNKYVFTDTIKHRKGKFTFVDDQGNKKVYDSIDDLPPAERAKFDSLEKKFNSVEWKHQMESMTKMGSEMNKKFNSPEWKKQNENWQKQALAMSKQFNSQEWKNKTEVWKKQAEEMNKKFNSQEWKDQSEKWAKQSEELSKKFNSAEWKEQAEKWGKQAEEMNKKFNSKEWKDQSEAWKKQSEEMSKKFSSPEWKKQMENMSKMGEEMSKKFDSPEWKKQMENMGKMGEEMSKKFNSPEWKKQMEDMGKMGGGHWVLKDTTGDVQIYAPERPERKEKAEKKEKAERKLKKDKTEKKKKTE